ncbi:MAG: ABC transporter permease, partial [Verrucomicrobia bacterium]|nr:ABC transporter permease [Verrucomicrobiota bacterium]
ALTQSGGTGDGGNGGGRLVLNVTHSLARLEHYDTVVVLVGGVVAYAGRPEFLAHYFSVETAEDIYPRLANRTPIEWRDSWRKHGEHFEEDEAAAIPLEKIDRPPVVAPTPPATKTPDFATQFRVVLERRLRLFLRDRAGLALQAALVLGFPCLVVIFALRGLPQIRNLSLEGELNVIEQLRESAAYLAQAVDVGGLVSGLLLFQIILLALMGANNAALEIAGERQLFESEKLAGLSPAAYLGAKTLFLTGLVTVQAVWMAAFVRWVCAFPGDFFGQVALLWLADAAVTAVCLAFSSWARSAQQASLVSIYFVGFQLPLSGAVLALPENLALVTRPFIAAYWSWAGAVGTLRDTRFYDLVLTITKTELSALPACVWVLAAHIALGLLVAWLGCRRTENK